jgi:hypothetical protein
MDSIMLCGSILAAQQFLAAAALILDNIPTQHEGRVEKKLKQEAIPYKCILAVHCGPQ